VGETTTNTPTAGAPAAIAASRCSIEQGQTPPLVEHRRQPSESLLYAGACLGLLLCRDTILYLLIGTGLGLFHVRWSLSCRGSSLLRRGSWIAERVASPHGRMDWRPLSTPMERCAWNMTLVMPEPMLSSRASLPRRVSPAPGPNSSPNSTRCWSNARSFFAYRRWTWRCERRYWRRSRSTACIPLIRVGPVGGTRQDPQACGQDQRWAPPRPGDYHSWSWGSCSSRTFPNS
jgi:hypothetical protein